MTNSFGTWLIALAILSIPLWIIDNDRTRYGYVFVVLLSVAMVHYREIVTAINDVQSSIGQ